MSDSISPQERCEAVARITGHRFADLHLLEQGLSHASTCSHIEDPKERLAGHNERLEFLGDAMLGAAVAYMLYERFPEADEGFMSRCKGQLVSRKTLAKAMHQHGLLHYAHLGNQMDQDTPTSVLANLAEGLWGLFISTAGGFPCATRCLHCWMHNLPRPPTSRPLMPKTACKCGDWNTTASCRFTNPSAAVAATMNHAFIRRFVSASITPALKAALGATPKPMPRPNCSRDWLCTGSSLLRSGLKTDTSQMTPIFSHWQGELNEGIAQLFRGQINATSGEKRKSDEVIRF